VEWRRLSNTSKRLLYEGPRFSRELQMHKLNDRTDPAN
jgi:hypothetical protein